MHSGLCVIAEEPEFSSENPECVCMGREHAFLCSEGDIAIQTALKNSPEQKTVPCSQEVEKHERPMENSLLTERSSLVVRE